MEISRSDLVLEIKLTKFYELSWLYPIKFFRIYEPKRAPVMVLGSARVPFSLKLHPVFIYNASSVKIVITNNNGDNLSE